MANSIEVVNYRPGWQVLRVSTLSENNPYGGMTKPDGAVDAINRMLNYIKDANPEIQQPENSYVSAEITRMQTPIEWEYATRIYRVYRFIISTINGLANMNIYTLPHVEQLRSVADVLQDQVNLPLVSKMAGAWNWEVIRFELENLWRQERSWFMAISADMKERVVEKDKTASHMIQFITLMREVNSLGSGV